MLSKQNVLNIAKLRADYSAVFFFNQKFTATENLCANKMFALFLETKTEKSFVLQSINLNRFELFMMENMDLKRRLYCSFRIEGNASFSSCFPNLTFGLWLNIKCMFYVE